MKKTFIKASKNVVTKSDAPSLEELQNAVTMRKYRNTHNIAQKAEEDVDSIAYSTLSYNDVKAEFYKMESGAVDDLYDALSYASGLINFSAHAGNDYGNEFFNDVYNHLFDMLHQTFSEIHDEIDEVYEIAYDEVIARWLINRGIAENTVFRSDKEQDDIVIEMITKGTVVYSNKMLLNLLKDIILVPANSKLKNVPVNSKSIDDALSLFLNYSMLSAPNVIDARVYYQLGELNKLVKLITGDELFEYTSYDVLENVFIDFCSKVGVTKNKDFVKQSNHFFLERKLKSLFDTNFSGYYRES